MLKFIIDKDIELKILEDDDAQELFELIDSCRSHLRKWLPWIDDTNTIEDIVDFIDITKQQFSSNQGFQMGIWYKGNLAGVIGYHGISWYNYNISIGYWLGEKYVGKGIMTKACRALVEYAFNKYKLNRVEIRCALENRRSRAIPKRLGFTKEGVIREAELLYTYYVSHVVYGMLASEWNR